MESCRRLGICDDHVARRLLIHQTFLRALETSTHWLMGPPPKPWGYPKKWMVYIWKILLKMDEFLRWDDDIPNVSRNKSDVPNHQSTD